MQKTDWLNRLAKWRAVFAGWQLGTRRKGDPECDAVRDHREATIMQRAEMSALTQILIDKGLFTVEDFKAQLDIEAELLCEQYEKSFPGFKATDDGITITAPAAQTMRGWRP
jgi:hypothetical protein